MAEEVLKQNMEQLNVQQESTEPEEDFVDPWTVTSNSDTGIDYDKLIRKLILAWKITALLFLVLEKNLVWHGF